MTMDGRAIAADVIKGLKPRRERIGLATLALLVVSENAVTSSYVGIKKKRADELGVRIRQIDLPESSTQDDIERAVELLRDDETVDGIIVQLPLPRGVNTERVLAIIPAEKDVDGIKPNIEDHERKVIAPVALAVKEILARAAIDISEKKAVVVGAGVLVGLPVAGYLKAKGANVSFFTRQQGSIEDLKDADIIVSGAGSPGFIKPEHIKEGVVLIDAGTSESGGKVVGDCDPACAAKAAVFTPVPGGVGPIAVAMIYKNLFDLIEMKR